MLLVVPNEYPRFIQSPTLKAMELGRTALMLCEATGVPPPNYVWLKDFLPFNLTDPRINIMSTGKCHVVKSH